MNLDYSSFDQPVTKADIDKLRAADGDKGTYPDGRFYITAGVFFFVFTLLAAIGSFVMNQSVSPVLIVVAIIGLLVVFATWRGAGYFAKRRARLYRFTEANNIRLITDANNPEYKGLMFQQGRDRTIDEAMIFDDATEIGNYSYETGTVKYPISHRRGYIRMKLPHSLSKQQIDTDVRAVAGNSGRNFKIEITGDMLLLSSRRIFKLDSEKTIKELREVIDAIGSVAKE